MVKKNHFYRQSKDTVQDPSAFTDSPRALKFSVMLQRLDLNDLKLTFKGSQIKGNDNTQ